MTPHVTRFPADAIAKAIKHFHTPFFLYEEEQILRNVQIFEDSFRPLFPDFTPLFAYKALPNPYIIKILKKQGWGADISSYTEAWLANELDNFGMHTGNFSTKEELEYVIKSPNLLLNLDETSMIPTVKEIGMPEYISFRINPGMSSTTMEGNAFAGPNAKYGIPWEKAVDAYRKAQEAGATRFGIHMMTGSNVAEEDYFSVTTKKLFEVAGTIHKELGIEFEYFNIGGGFNVPYEPTEPTFDIGKIAQQVRTIFDEECAQWNMKEPKLMIEPGRRVTCDAGFLVGKVQVIKDGYKKFIGIDVSTNAMPRTAFYGAYHHISVLGKEKSDDTETVNVTGSICENNDQWCIDRELPKMDIGDTVIIHNCGAHASAMGHNYNGKVRPAEILLQKDGSFKEIRRAETVEDLHRTIIEGWNN